MVGIFKESQNALKSSLKKQYERFSNDIVKLCRTLNLCYNPSHVR